MHSLYILAAIFLWSSLGIVVRLSGVETHTLIFYSVIVSVIAQTIIISIKGYWAEFPDIKMLRFPLMLGIASLMNTFTYYYAFNHTTIANAVLTHYIAPVIVAFLAHFFLKEQLTINIFLALVIASIGLWAMFEGLSFQGNHATGILAGTFSGLAYAVIVVMLRLHSAKFNPFILSFLSGLVILIILAPFIREFPVKAIWSFIFMGIVHSTIAPVLYFKGLRVVTANRTAILGYLEPVGAIFLSVIIFNELPGKGSIMGGLLILTSGYLALRGEKK